jgi:hypothetical protein
MLPFDDFLQKENTTLWELTIFDVIFKIQNFKRDLIKLLLKGA